MLGNLSITFGQPWWLILIPLILPPLVWMSFRSLAGLGPVRRALAIVLPGGGDHADRPGPGRAADGPADRPADDDVPGRRLQQRAPRAAEGGARLRHRGVEEAAQGRPGRRDRLRQGAAGRGPAGPQRAQPAGRSRARSTPRTPTWARPSSWPWRRFPEDTARRIVVLSDGNENRGNLLEQALAAKSLGVQVDVLPIEYSLRPRGPGREGVDPARRQEGRDGQHQRGDPRQRADQRHARRSSRRPTTTAPRRPATRSPCRSSSSAGSTSSRSSS